MPKRKRRPAIHAKRRYVFATHRIRRLIQKAYVQDSQAIKPAGLWYSVGDAWHRWATSNWHVGNYVHEITIDPARVLVIDTEEKFLNFNARYGPGPRDPFAGMFLRWSRVADDYAGIEIAPYMHRFRLEHGWYYGWDAASGCIWDVSAVTAFRYLGRM